MPHSDSTAGSGPPWEPLSFVDYLVLGTVGTLQAAAFFVWVHLIRCRKWPPYLVKNVDIVILMTFAGFFWTFAKALETGLIRRSEGDVLAWCCLETFLSWSTLCMHTGAFFIRVHRMWRILIKHDDNMWPAKYQIMLLSSVSLLPLAVAVLVPGAYFFDETVNSCNTTAASRNVVLGMSVIGFYMIWHLWFVYGRQLRWVRKQFNEYETMRRTSTYLTLVLVSYAIVLVAILDNHHVIVRRVAIVYPALTTHLLLWGSIGEPFVKKLTGDEDYLWAYTKGFSELPSPAQLKASLAEQLSVEQLRTEFRGYIQTKVAQELVDFYLDSLDREEVTGFFDRQAVTMRIVQRFIREGAPEQVNISGECREEIMSTDVTAHDIFDRARVEVLAVMETNFQHDFVATEGFRRIVDASELEQRELRLLRAGGYLRSDSETSPVSPASASSPYSRPRRLADYVKRLPGVRRLFILLSSSSSSPAISPAVRGGGTVNTATAANSTNTTTTTISLTADGTAA